jgi:hypothetical protein
MSEVKQKNKLGSSANHHESQYQSTFKIKANMLFLLGGDKSEML